jgi:hypothetical protein
MVEGIDLGIDDIRDRVTDVLREALSVWFIERPVIKKLHSEGDNIVVEGEVSSPYLQRYLKSETRNIYKFKIVLKKSNLELVEFEIS